MESNNPKKILFASVVLAVLVFGCHTVNQYWGLPDDGPLEQISEEVLNSIIEHELGINPHIDLTP